MPIPMAFNATPPRPQHPCTVCRGGAHGSGFGCCELFSDVLNQLDRSHSQLMNNLDTNSGSAVICGKCFHDLAVANIKGGGGGDKDADSEDCDDDIVMVSAAAGKPRPKKQQTLSLSGSTKKVTAQKKKETYKKRKSRKHFTIHEKLSILDELKKGLSTQATIAAKHGTTRHSLSRWKRERTILEEQAAGGKRGKKKRMFVNDPLIKIKEGIVQFYDLNEVFPKALKIPITSKFFSIITYIMH